MWQCTGCQAFACCWWALAPGCWACTAAPSLPPCCGTTLATLPAPPASWAWLSAQSSTTAAACCRRLGALAWTGARAAPPRTCASCWASAPCRAPAQQRQQSSTPATPWTTFTVASQSSTQWCGAWTARCGCTPLAPCCCSSTSSAPWQPMLQLGRRRAWLGGCTPTPAWPLPSASPSSLQSTCGMRSPTCGRMVRGLLHTALTQPPLQCLALLTSSTHHLLTPPPPTTLCRHL